MPDYTKVDLNSLQIIQNDTVPQPIKRGGLSAHTPRLCSPGSRGRLACARRRSTSRVTSSTTSCSTAAPGRLPRTRCTSATRRRRRRRRPSPSARWSPTGPSRPSSCRPSRTHRREPCPGHFFRQKSSLFCTKNIDFLYIFLIYFPFPEK